MAPSAVMLEARRKEFAKAMHDVLAQGQEQRATCQVGLGTGAAGNLSGRLRDRSSGQPVR